MRLAEIGPGFLEKPPSFSSVAQLESKNTALVSTKKQSEISFGKTRIYPSLGRLMLQSRHLLLACYHMLQML